MSETLTITTLGGLSIRRGDDPVTGFASRKVEALLVYLACTSRPQPREVVAEMLWEERSQSQALANLRVVLSSLRKHLASYVTITRDTVALDQDADPSTGSGRVVWLDAIELERKLSAGQVEEAVALYRGDFLAGFYVRDAPGFEDWAAIERERLRQIVLGALNDLVAYHLDVGDYAAGIRHAHRLLELDPLLEQAHRQMMRLLAYSGQRGAALEQYETCRHLLQRELAVEPMPETTDLYAQIQAGTLEAPAIGGEAAKEIPPAPGEPPFKGLQYFDVADADLFFGRELLTARLIERLRHTLFLHAVGEGDGEERFLAIVGTSGSGKSSLVRAGLVAAMRRNAPLADGTRPPEGSDRWPMHIITPTAHPLESLAVSLTRDVDSVKAVAALIADLADDPRGLHLYVRKTLAENGSDHLLLVVDQFEELFTQCRDPDQRRAFMDNLLTAASTAGPILVVIALRADFYHHCAQFERLRDALEKYQAYIGPMTPEELRNAIEEPARAGGWRFEPGLVDLLLRDVGDEPGALPLLSHALLETWKRRRGHTLTLGGYAEAGGVRGAIAETAETVYQRLDEHQQAIARNIFLRLTELGEGTEDTRRRATRDELFPRPEEATAVEAVLSTLADARLVTTEKETVQVAHEALIREWPTLQEWLEEDREGLRVHRHLTEAARGWERMERDSGELYRGARLAQASEWASAHPEALNPLEREFLAASEEWVQRREAEREAQRQRELEAARKLAEERASSAVRLRRRAVWLALALVVALAAAITAGAFGNQARTTSNANATLAAQEAAQRAVAQTAEALEADQRIVAETAQAQEAVQRIAAEVARAEAEDAEAVALSRLSRQLASHSADRLDADNNDVALLLAIEAGRAADTAEASSVLHRIFTHLGRAWITLSGHGDRVWWGEWNGDGSRILTASEDGTIRVWNVATGAELLTLSGHTAGVRQAVWNADESRVLTISDDGTARVWDAKTGAELLALSGHTKSVNYAVWNSGEDRILTASDDGTARVWDAEMGIELLILSGHTKSVNYAVWTSDEGRILTVSDDGTARIWDAQTGAELLTLSGHMRAVLHAVWSADGNRILTASRDGTARVWDADTGAELVTLLGYTGAVRQASWNADESRILTASSDGAVRVWDAETGAILITLSRHTDEVWQAVWNADESRILTASEDGTARVWDAETGVELLILSGQSGGVAQAVWDGDESHILTVGADGTVRIWDAATGAERATLSGHTNWVWQAAWNKDESRILTSSWDGTVRIWDAATGAEQIPPAGHVTVVGQAVPEWPPPGPASAVWNSDESLILTASRDGAVRVWDAATGTELFTLSGHTDRVFQAMWNSDESRILTWGEDGTTRVWDAETGAELVTLSAHADTVWWAEWSGDESRILTAECDRRDSGGLCVESTVRVWDVETGAELVTLSGNLKWVWQAVWNRDESRILTRSDEGIVRVWDAATGAELVTLSGHDGPVWAAVWNSDESRILTAGLDNTARVWDAVTGEELLTLSGHTNEVFRAAWNSDESRILTAGIDGTARVWDAETGNELFTLSGHTDSVFQAEWNSDESHILTVSADGTVRQWYARTEDLLEAACQRAPRNMTTEEWRRFMGDEAYRATCPNLPVPEEVIGGSPVDFVEEDKPGVVAGCTYNAYRMGWVMDYADAEDMLNVVFHPDSTFQHTFWDDETFRDLIDQAMVEKDFDIRMRLWQEAESILVTDYAAVVPVYHYDRTVLMRPEIEAVFPPFGPPYIKHWRLPQGQTTLRYPSGEPATLDNTGSDANSALPRHQIMEALYEYDGEGRIQPAGAVSHEVSEDGLIYTIHLREDATWSDGEPVVAQHYVDGITRLLDPETAADYAWLIYIVQGAEAFNTGETGDPSTLGLRAVDDHTLKITLEEAASHFDTLLAFNTFYPARLDVIERYGDLWTEPGNFVGNGAYVLTEWAHYGHMDVEKNPHYWGADDVTIERIEFPLFAFEPTALAAYERGELDVNDMYPIEELPRILEEMPDHFRRTPRPGTYYIGLNLLRPPTDNLNLRKALASAVDKWAIMDDVLKEPWRIAACGVVPPEVPGYQGCGYVGYEFDVRAAKQYLQAAMDEMGIDDPADISVDLWFNQAQEDVMESVAAQWEANLGINVTVSSTRWADYTDTLGSCWDSYRSGE